MSAGGRTTSRRSTGPNIDGFTGLVWIIGLVIAGITCAIYADDGTFEVGAVGRSDDYSISPWTSDDPVVAEESGGGVYEGSDGAVIRLSGVDVTQPLVVSPEGESYISSVRVTGPQGRIVTPGEYEGDPPRFRPLADGRVAIFVEQPDVELWVDGSRDENWRARVSSGGLNRANDVVTAFSSADFLHIGEASTARVTVRGKGSVDIQIVTPQGTDSVLSGDAPIDQSVAWRDAPLVLFSVTAWDDAGWRIEFPPSATPSASPSPEVTP